MGNEARKIYNKQPQPKTKNLHVAKTLMEDGTGLFARIFSGRTALVPQNPRSKEFEVLDDLIQKNILQLPNSPTSLFNNRWKAGNNKAWNKAKENTTLAQCMQELTAGPDNLTLAEYLKLVEKMFNELKEENPSFDFQHIQKKICFPTTAEITADFKEKFKHLALRYKKI